MILPLRALTPRKLTLILERLLSEGTLRLITLFSKPESSSFRLIIIVMSVVLLLVVMLQLTNRVVFRGLKLLFTLLMKGGPRLRLCLTSRQKFGTHLCSFSLSSWSVV